MNLHDLTDIPINFTQAALWINNRGPYSGYVLAFRPRDKTYYYKSNNNPDWSPLDPSDIHNWAIKAHEQTEPFARPPCHIEVLR